MPAPFALRAAAAAPAAVFAVALFAASAARADLKIVQKVTTSGTGPGQSAAKSGTATSYYKGRKIRREEQGGTVTIYDATTRKLLVLNPAQKTYAVVDPNAAANPMMAAMHFETTATVGLGGQARTIGGKPAKNYVYKATMTASPPAGTGGSSSVQRQRLSIQMDGEVWTTEAFAGAVGGNAPEMSAMSAQVPGLKPLMDKLATIKGVALASRQKTTFGMSATSSIGASTMGSNTVSTELVSLSEAPLPDTLFAVPKGYTLAKNTPRPRPAGMGGGMGGGAMRPAPRTTP